LAEPTFDRSRFTAALRTRRLGRTLIARAEADSTNDVAWEALAARAPDGTVVVADAQPRGRGRAGRSWHLAPGRGLAMSLLLRDGCDREHTRALPLVIGVALARALDGLGLAADLKWPNDLLVAGRKLAGILCESRRAANGVDAVVIGVGINVLEQAADFPPELEGRATSLAMEGRRVTREEVAARFLNALEPLWTETQEGDVARALEDWKRRASFWGRTVTVRSAAGAITGIAHDLDAEGALVLRLEDGRQVTALAGDVETAPR
jgi:BirA family transcriptional regulator, biotin operon repressor / biotin---[acetyl-CoA-carboxylase] ligase